MGATVNVNDRTVVHKASDGVATNPGDVCKTPAPPAPPVPTPYPNVALSSDTASGSRDVKMDGKPIMLENSMFSKSTGDEAGSVGGVVSGCIKGKAEFTSSSTDVTVEGKAVPRQGDSMLQNKGNTPPIPLAQPPAVVVVTGGGGGGGAAEEEDEEAEEEEEVTIESLGEEEGE
jgi:uncharacterized Zn-binding protein involved in type VI secretion